MNVRCIGLCVFLPRELVFHSLSLRERRRRADDEQTLKGRRKRGVFGVQKKTELKIYLKEQNGH